MELLNWEQIGTFKRISLYRAQVPLGWLGRAVATNESERHTSLVFVDDAGYMWGA